MSLPAEWLDRGVVAIRSAPNKVVVSWRVLGTDPDEMPFDLYRQTGDGQPEKLNGQPITGATFFIDEAADASEDNRYFVKSGETTLPGSYLLKAGDTRPYLSVPLQVPPPAPGSTSEEGYAPNDASVGDLDGDGQYEIILHWTGVAKDNSQKGVTDPPILQAYRLDGTLLWTINLGRNIRDGAHYTQFLVYDFDGDGRAEMICKTADGTTDGKGKVIGDPDANHVNEGGYILKGPEFLTVFDGLTGAAIDTVRYAPARTLSGSDEPSEMKSLWGDSYGNRGDRFLACVANLDGQRPSAVFTRGYYTRTALAAYDFREGKLSLRWIFDTGNDPSNRFAGQGNHNLSVADVNGDGKDDIIFGGMCVDSSGRGLWSTEYGHGDAIHIGDLDPETPGLEMFRIQERWDDAGAHLVSLRDGRTLWKKPSVSKPAGGKNQGPGRGIAADIDPRYPGAECWALGAGIDALWDAKGNLISEKVPTMSLGSGQVTFGVENASDSAAAVGRQVASCNFRVYWDGDLLDELLDRNQIAKWDYERGRSVPLLVAEDCRANNGTKATPTLSADILGDWREEVIWPTNDGRELRIYTTPIPTEHRCYTLMHDPQYRLSIAWQNVAYNQPPHVSWDFFSGKPPKPNIHLVEPAKGGAQ